MNLKTVDFDLQNVTRMDISEAVKSVLMIKMVPLFETQVKELGVGTLTPVLSQNGIIVTYTPQEPQETLATLGESLRNEVVAYLQQTHNKKLEKTKQDFEELKAKCDFVFAGHKEYETLCKGLDGLLYCEATPLMRSYFNKVMSSQSAKNLVFHAKLKAYSSTTKCI